MKDFQLLGDAQEVFDVIVAQSMVNLIPGMGSGWTFLK